ncbi:hypothetical protein [uncultured Jatrophihabitans sp.]|uniref:hypothetical protein n=1 Tax=uncultured Jatrophihabitans sp. TaxID=1610747 RepID=UPI0035C9782E
MTTRRRRLHIVVTCANRKRVTVPAALHLRRTHGTRTGQRALRWIERIVSANTVDTVSARDLYAGEHWDIARNLPAAASGFVHPTLWVASAGWGLIPAEAPIRPYSATFSPRHLDSVASDIIGTQAWWEALATWEGPTKGAARSVTALISEHPRDRVLLVLSQPYLAACSTDLHGALQRAAAGQVSVIAAGATGAGGHAALADVLLPADARLQHHIGGTRGSLNVRIAKHVLMAGLSDHAAMSEQLRRQLAEAPMLVSYGRRRLSDEDVLAFIRTRLTADTTLTHSRLLRVLRDAGLACEQARFKGLFATATRSLS